MLHDNRTRIGLRACWALLAGSIGVLALVSVPHSAQMGFAAVGITDVTVLRVDAVFVKAGS